ncbi:MAG TPA: trypsin-like peptidase domain-containing protein [Bdellovibrionota bacterium]|nr:trypsin-like peptidase domain-containing protein [Bdellovibrionota bacterium]
MLWILALLAATPSLAAMVAPVDLPDLVEKTLPGVVNVSSTTVINHQVHGMEEFLRFWGLPQERKQSSLGSGFLIDKDGFLITNYHVVQHADEVMITLHDKRQFPARIIGKDQKMDLALLQIRDQERKVPPNLLPVPLGDSTVVRIAQTVFAVGNPFGLEHTVTVGIISAKDRTIGQGPFDNFLQTDASINPGNSGGPLFNLKGEVVGINTMIISRTGQSGGLGFAIPINEAKALIPDLKRYGRIPRPWLGVLSQPMTRQLQVYYGLPASKGVLVVNVVEGGPADRAGLQQGDIIAEMDGTEVKEPNDVERRLAKHRPTEGAKVKVLRGKRALEVNMKLEELPKLDDLPKGII